MSGESSTFQPKVLGFYYTHGVCLTHPRFLPVYTADIMSSNYKGDRLILQFCISSLTGRRIDLSSSRLGDSFHVAAVPLEMMPASKTHDPKIIGWSNDIWHLKSESVALWIDDYLNTYLGIPSRDTLGRIWLKHLF